MLIAILSHLTKSANVVRGSTGWNVEEMDKVSLRAPKAHQSRFLDLREAPKHRYLP